MTEIERLVLKNPISAIGLLIGKVLFWAKCLHLLQVSRGTRSGGPEPNLPSYEAAAKPPPASSKVLRDGALSPPRITCSVFHGLLNPPPPPPPPSPAPHIAIEILLLDGNPLPWQLASCLTYINAGMRFTGPAEERSTGVLTSASCSCRTRQAFLKMHPQMHNVCVVCVCVDFVFLQLVEHCLLHQTTTSMSAI